MDIPGYTIKYRIAKGRYASLYLAHNVQGDIRAIKVIHSSLSNQFLFRQAFKKQIKILTSIKHTHCMHVYDAGISGRHCYIVMDYYPNGSIAPRLIFGFPVKQITQIIKQLIDALEYINKIKLEHGNIQPRNIFLSKDNQTILSEYEIVPQILKNCPDIHFSEDELLLNQLVDTQSDLSCLGLVFFKLLNRETTPYLEIPVYGLSGKRAKCWQTTINKLFSSQMDDSINSIQQFRQEINRVQDAFKSQNIQTEAFVSDQHLAHDSIDNKAIDKAFETVSNIKITAIRDNFPVILEQKTNHDESSIRGVLNQFLLNNKTPIMTGLAASTVFFLMLSGITFFNMKNPTFSLINTLDTAWFDTKAEVPTEIQRTKIRFPGEYTAAQKNKTQYPDLVTNIEELKLTQADIKQKNRLAAIKRAEKNKQSMKPVQKDTLALVN
ncbi:protein kinase family protein [sulfur-oxidizing endosymbiont of Gigantopelta aegis]|uniref:protein kinase family protein n=1 Tax=sulfur-oxidizing endosymbiont of Gigantopelta aegis TaxID=2794934 RepID=UPI0018DC264B|nr:protein kinase family protein [sulfur-oxidizing endosymbiont of Gigantopelta aegis]